MDKGLKITFCFFVVAVACEFSAAAAVAKPHFESSTLARVIRRLDQPDLKSRFKQLDCSHFVHALYESLGLTYRYATSRSLYKGIPPFKRVIEPEFGDLVVWRGHVGIVVDPSRHRFISTLKSGMRVASYISTYWRNRGNPRFFRFALRDPTSTCQDALAITTTNGNPQNSN